MKGLFITFEGGEGAGKTTLIEQIAKTLFDRDFSVLKTREPGGTALGEQIRDILLHKAEFGPMSPYAELSLFLASRAQHVSEVIGPALRSGTIVLCDRFNDSSIAYQGGARGLGMDSVASMCEFISQGVEPQITFYLDIEAEIGLTRVRRARGTDRIEAEKLSFHEKIREAYLLLHKKYPKRLHLLDASQPPGRVFQDAMEWIEPWLKNT